MILIIIIVVIIIIIIIITIIIIIILIIIIIIIIIDVHRGDSLISWGEGSSLALVDKHSRDGASIKILVIRHFKPTPNYMSALYLLNR